VNSPQNPADFLGLTPDERLLGKDMSRLPEAEQRRLPEVDERAQRLVLGAGVALISFSGLTVAYVGAALFGLGMAGWMLPLGVLRRETPPAQIAWWTSLYRVGVDGGLFLGPFLSGLLAGTAAGLVPGVVAGILVGVGVLMLRGEARRA
jgi:MFS family permease